MEMQELDDALDKLRNAIHSHTPSDDIDLILSHLGAGHVDYAAKHYMALNNEERKMVRRLFESALALCILGDNTHG